MCYLSRLFLHSPHTSSRNFRSCHKGTFLCIPRPISDGTAYKSFIKDNQKYHKNNGIYDIYDKISFYLFLLFFRISDSFQTQPEFQFLDTSFKNDHTCYNGSYCFQYHCQGHSILPFHKTNYIPSYCQ